MTAELAAALPAALLVVALCLGGFGALTQRAMLADAAAQTARALARQAAPPPLPAAVELTERRDGGLLCIRLTATAPLGIPVDAEACAPEDGR